MGLEAFSLWLQEVAAVQEDVLMTGNPNADKPKWASKDKPKNSTFSTFADDSADKKTGHDCPLKGGKHPLWKCEKCSKTRILDYWIAKRSEERQSEMC